MAPARPPEARGSNIDIEARKLSCDVVGELVEAFEENRLLVLVVELVCDVLEVLVFEPTDKIGALPLFGMADCPNEMEGEVKRISALTKK